MVRSVCDFRFAIQQSTTKLSEITTTAVCKVGEKLLVERASEGRDLVRVSGGRTKRKFYYHNQL